LTFVTNKTQGEAMRPELPDYGVYLQWPNEGSGWIHPEDVAIVESLIPSDRVFLRESFDGTYYHLRYGDKRFRVLPSMWNVVRGEDFHIGDHVEIRSRNDQNMPGVGVISEMRFAQETQRIHYTVVQREFPLPTHFLSEDLINLTSHERLSEPRTEHPPQRMAPLSDVDYLKL
jgi:hypothetical protein